MTPALLLPAALGALAALLIPLVIHIARRTEGRPVPFAALRWLDPRPRPRRRLRIDERWLLAVRMLLLAMLALWLARPVLWGVEDTRRVVALAPGLDASVIKAAEGDRLIRLAPGFPPIGDTGPAQAASLVSLIRQLDAELPRGTPLELVVPPVLMGVDAERPRLSRPVTWRVVPDDRPAARPEPTLPPGLTVRYSPGAPEGVRYFRAAATAWTPPDTTARFDAAPVDRPIEPKARYLVWLAPGAVPAPVVAWIKDGGTALLAREVRSPSRGALTVVWRDPIGEPLATAGRLGQGRVIQLTRALEPAAIPELLEPHFPDALMSMLVPSPAPAQVAAADHAPLPGGKPYDPPPFDLRPWLALLMALVFGIERWLATRRQRAAAP